MITEKQAGAFATEWIQAWNSHDIDSIMKHYADNIEFYSPFITLLKFNDTGVITSGSELKNYFEIGLNAYPDLKFILHNVFTGIDTVTIYYTSVNKRMAAEVFQIGGDGKARKVFCNYSNRSSNY